MPINSLCHWWTSFWGEGSATAVQRGTLATSQIERELLKKRKEVKEKKNIGKFVYQVAVPPVADIFVWYEVFDLMDIL